MTERSEALKSKLDPREMKDVGSAMWTATLEGERILILSSTSEVCGLNTMN